MNILPKATGVTYSPSKCSGLHDTSSCPTSAPFRHPALEEEVGERTQKEVRGKKEEEVKPEDIPRPQIHPEKSMRMMCPLVAKGRLTGDSCAPCNLQGLGPWNKGKGEGVGGAKEGALRGLPRPLSKQT